MDAQSLGWFFIGLAFGIVYSRVITTHIELKNKGNYNGNKSN